MLYEIMAMFSEVWGSLYSLGTTNGVSMIMIQFYISVFTFYEIYYPAILTV